MKANAYKCYVLLSSSNDLTVNINQVQIKNSQSEKLLRIIIDNDLLLLTDKFNIANFADENTPYVTGDNTSLTPLLNF